MPLAVIFFTDRTNIRADIFVLPGSLPMYQEIAKASFMRATAVPELLIFCLADRPTARMVRVSSRRHKFNSSSFARCSLLKQRNRDLTEEAMKILSIFGTRPEAIKMAPLVKRLALERDVTSLICVTGQHRTMLQQVMDVFDITADYDLDIMAPNQTLNSIGSRIFAALDPILERVNP